MWKCIQVKGHLIPTRNMTPDGNKFIIKKHSYPEGNDMACQYRTGTTKNLQNILRDITY